MDYLNEIISALIGLLAGIGLTLTYQKMTYKDESKNQPKQSQIKTGGGDFAGRDMYKDK